MHVQIELFTQYPKGVRGCCPVGVLTRWSQMNVEYLFAVDRSLYNECVYLQASLRVALPDAGVAQLQLGSEAQMTLLPFFLMYLYSMAILAGNVTVAFCVRVSSENRKNPSSSTTHQSTPGNSQTREESRRLVTSCQDPRPIQRERRSLFKFNESRMEKQLSRAHC